MAAIELRYSTVYFSKGGRYAYYRRFGRRTRLPDPDDAGFLAAYQAAHAAAEAHAAAIVKVGARVPPKPGSLAALTAAYQASEDWRQHAQSTKDEYRRALDRMDERWGELPVATMPRAFVFKLRDEFARGPLIDRRTKQPVLGPDGKPVVVPTPRLANRMVAVLRLLLSWAVDRGWRKDNPALRPGRLRTTGEGYPRWTEAEFRQFMAAADVGEPIKRAAALAYYTGMRVSDCVALPKVARRDGWIEIVPAKTKHTSRARARVPEHPELTRILDAAPPHSALTLLARRDGKSWQVEHVKHVIARSVRAAGLRPGLSFHGLRKALHASLAERGATDAEMEAVVPHADPRMTRHYRAQADQETLARSAMAKLQGL